MGDKLNHLNTLKQKLQLSIEKESLKIKNLTKEKTDSQTNITLHKNAIVNYIQEHANLLLSNNDEEDNKKKDLTDKISKLIVYSKEIDKQTLKLSQFFMEKEILQKELFIISSSVEDKRKRNLEKIESLRKENKFIEERISFLKNEVERSNKEHDNMIINGGFTISHEIYTHSPYQSNIDLYMEKILGTEIMNKLNIIMNDEKEKSDIKQNKIKSLIRHISKLKKEVNLGFNKVIIEKSENSNDGQSNINKDSNENNYYKYNSNIINNKGELKLSPTNLRNSIIKETNINNEYNTSAYENDDEESIIDKININYLGESIESHLFQFPNKIKQKLKIGKTIENGKGKLFQTPMLNQEYNTNNVIPNLNFDIILNKYKQDRNIIIKEEKIKIKKEDLNQILYNLVGSSKVEKEMKEGNENIREEILLKNEISQMEILIQQKKNELIMQKGIFKERKTLNISLNESITKADIELKELNEEIKNLSNNKDYEDNINVNIINDENVDVNAEKRDLFFDVFNFNEENAADVNGFTKNTKLFQKIQMINLNNDVNN